MFARFKQSLPSFKFYPRYVNFLCKYCTNTCNLLPSISLRTRLFGVLIFPCVKNWIKFLYSFHNKYARFFYFARFFSHIYYTRVISFCKIFYSTFHIICIRTLSHVYLSFNKFSLLIIQLKLIINTISRYLSIIFE